MSSSFCLLAMPTGEYIYAKDLNNVLKKKHAAKSYKSMVSYQLIVIPSKMINLQYLARLVVLIFFEVQLLNMVLY